MFLSLFGGQWMTMTLDCVLEVICPETRSENCVGATIVFIYTTEVPVFVVVYLFSTIIMRFFFYVY